MKKQYITNKAGERIFPYTHISAVLDDNGNSLDTLLAVIAQPTVGTSTERDTMILEPSDIGMQFFDTSLKKPVYVSEVSADGLATWVDATGSVKAYAVKYSLTHLQLSSALKSASAGESYTFTLEGVTEEEIVYALPSSIVVKMGGSTLDSTTDYTYNSTTGVVQINGVAGTGGITGLLEISASGVLGGGQNPGQGV